jgi:hypothetical protein
MAAKKKRQRTQVTLHYPKHALAPEDLLDFIEASGFSQKWDDLGLDVEHDLLALQLLIMANPTRAPVVSETGGLRKVRFAPPGSDRGKSGSLRVCYAYFASFGIVYLVCVYAKSEKDNLSAAEKKQIKKLLARIERELERRRQLK